MVRSKCRLALFQHLHQVFIITIDKDRSIVSKKEIIEFALGLAYSLERTKALQMSTSNIGDKSTIGLSCFYQCLDITGMRGSHLYNSYLCLVV